MVGRSTGRSLGGMQDAYELVPEDGEYDDENDGEERHAYQIVDEILVSLHIL